MSRESQQVFPQSARSAGVCSPDCPDRSRAAPGCGVSGTMRTERRTFTLLELLAALAISAVLLSALLGALRAVLTIRERADEAVTADVPASSALNRIGTDLRNIVAPGSTLSGAFVGNKIETPGGRQDTLEFATAANSPRDGVFGADIVRVGYEVSAEASATAENVLLRSLHRNLLAQVADPAEESILLRGVQTLSFAYYNGEVWVDSWDSSLADNQLPKAVEVTLALASRRQDGEPEFLACVIPVFVEASAPRADDDRGEGRARP